MYLVVDTDGALREVADPPTLTNLQRDAAAGDLVDVVRLHIPKVDGWVADDGIDMPKNMTGSLMLLMMGASQQPYHGAVVFTGRDPLSYTQDTVPLEPHLARALRQLHHDVRVFLGDEGVHSSWWSAGDDLELAAGKALVESVDLAELPIVVIRNPEEMSR